MDGYSLRRPVHIRHVERHRIGRTGWLRAAVLGANDGIVSIASLILGVVAAGSNANSIMVAGAAGLVAGAMSMAAGEYVSVSSQADTEQADLEKERRELAANPEREHEEMAALYVERGLDAELASRVARQLMRHDALGAHARDELGIVEMTAAKPIQAAMASAFSFSLGGALPLAAVLLSPAAYRLWVVAGSSLGSLALLGVFSAWIGGAPMLQATTRLAFWGALAMAVTAAVGTFFGISAAA